MKRGLKIFISIITVLCITCFTVMIDYQNAYAIGLSDLDFFYNLITNEDAPYSIYREAMYKSICGDMGIIIGPLTVWQAENDRKIVAKYLKKKYGTEKTEEQVTDEDIRNFYNDYRQNISVNRDDHSITYNDNSKLVLDTIVDTYIDSTGIDYGYSINLSQIPNQFEDGGYYAKIKELCEQYQDDYYILSCCPKYNTNNNVFIICSREEYGLVLTGINNDNHTFSAQPYNYENWQCLKLRNSTFTGFDYDGTTGEIVSSNYYNNYWGDCPNFSSTLEPNVPVTIVNPMFCLFSSRKACVYYLFKSVNDLKNFSVGNSPYYINSTVNNNWKNSSGDYTLNIDNSNHVTYQDVKRYIDEQPTAPSLPQIEDWIINQPSPTPTPTPTPGNPSGGGSTVSGNSNGGAYASATAHGGTASANNEGINITINNNHNINLGGGSGLSGNTVSGNGSGSSGGIGGIFDFLSQIGDFLGSLIKNIGNVLADIVTGIGSVVSSLLEVIPTVFNDFLGGVLGWLPPELRALVTLSISAMIIVGLIKLFRG